jgi:hypothetical protein
MSFSDLFDLGAIVWEGDLPTFPDYFPTDEDDSDI